jgi:hypothetical protein
MNSRWAILIAGSLVVFSGLVITWQIRHYDDLPAAHRSLSLSILRGEQLALITNIVDRSQLYIPASGTFCYLDLVLPEDARVFMTDMIGPTNYDKIGYYFYAAYYLFPREVGVSLDQPTRLAYNGFLGRTSVSDEEILAHGFNVRLDFSSRHQMVMNKLSEFNLSAPTNPAWFNSVRDGTLAFLLPLLTALTGMWLFRVLFFRLSGQMPMLEQLAYGLGLGMMAVAAFTLGIKLCGFPGRGLVLATTAVGAMTEVWRNRKVILTKITGGYGKMLSRPMTAIFIIVGLLIFLVLFRIAGLEGIVDPDAMRWLLKAKMMHLGAGNELVNWFSASRLAYAHLDYPTLVPSLHSATYDSLGHVNDFVTKFWPTWMLVFLLAALALQNRTSGNWRHVLSFTLLGLLLLPSTQEYVQMEGSTMPMIFYTALGFVQCSHWLVGKDPTRLALGLTLLLGGAMTHFEGFIFLAAAAGWLLLMPSAWPSFKLSSSLWRVLIFWFLAALPFVCLRAQIPVLQYESDWARYARHDPGGMLSIWPGIFTIQLARLFMGADFANWTGNGHIEWIGKWDGLSSLYNQATLALPWVSLLLTIVLWLTTPTRRRVVIWISVMFIVITAALTGVFASFVSVRGLGETIDYTLTGGRYLFPVQFAWFATILTMIFADLPSSASSLAPNLVVAERPPHHGTQRTVFPVLTSGYWLALGALLIMALVAFVLPKTESTSPESLAKTAAPINPLGDSQTPSLSNDDLQTRMDQAAQLEKAGKFNEAIQEYREAVRLYPNDPVALNNLAWSLVSSPIPELRNGKEAVQIAGKAVELTAQQQPICIGTLAAAYAEDGRFAKAVEMAERARDVAMALKQPDVAYKNEQFRKLYSAGKTIGSINEP